MSGSEHPRIGADALVSLLLFAGTVLYLAAWPHDLGRADESYFLLEAKRIREGEVPYRDLFVIVLPAAHWIMALLFAAFGTNIGTARLGMAALHAGAAAVLYLAGRRLGVRRSLAAAVPLAYVGLCQAPWPYASPHWFSTLLTVLLLWNLLGGAWRQRPGGAVVPGLLTGGLAAIQQQRAAVVAAGVSMLLCLDWLAARQNGRALALRVAAFGAGVGAVMVPLLLALVAVAGLDNVFDQTIRHPLMQYYAINAAGWGGVDFLNVSRAAYTWPALLKYAPAVVLVGVVRLVMAARRGEPADARWPLLVLVTVSVTAITSIGYHADFIHIAFIAPVLLVSAAETAEAALRVMDRAAAGRWLGRAAAAALVAALGVQLLRNHERAWRDGPFPHDTAFGRIDFATQREVDVVERIDALMAREPSRKFFVYPVLTSLYLATDTDNPTRHQFFLPGYNTPAQTKEILEQLKKEQLPYVLAYDAMLSPDDPILAFVRTHYECATPGEANCFLFRRRASVR